MSLDLTGINNENEFFTHHYLSAILDDDLKELFAQWRAQADAGEQADPPAALRRLATDYFRGKNRRLGPEESLAQQRRFSTSLLEALGYPVKPQVLITADKHALPCLATLVNGNGVLQMAVLEAFSSDKAEAKNSEDDTDEDTDPLRLVPRKLQFPADTDWSQLSRSSKHYEEQISALFSQPEPPRRILLLSHSQVLLLDRAKWAQKRLLRFDLAEILGRRDDSTLRASAALLHRQSLCPEDGLPLLETLDENSHKHAHAVSEDLKYALRECIELLGNEAIYSLREQKRAVFAPDMADQLSKECLRYMYRMLFLFYIEARPELKYIPVGYRSWDKGYSLESLRDLELVKLTHEAAKNGYYLHESLSILFKLVFKGTQYPADRNIFTGTMGEDLLFEMTPLQSRLFDPRNTPLLRTVKFRNTVLQRVIELMSLSKPGGKNKRRGRVSYSQLGINQLGAVYEALLSFRGFLAETDLYEVIPKGETPDPLHTGFFVREEDLHAYDDDEKVYDRVDDGDRLKQLRRFPKGSFIYRLAGRDREKSASYYTPEVLTRCLVKYSLKELIKDEMPAQQILQLTICEPAMGSAAFLNEAVNQLAEIYLQRRQQELGKTIAHHLYSHELQNVKMHLADHNVFGVDLNPVAVELAEVSLWLNSITKGGFVPWFGNQLTDGNSLIGARRQVYPSWKLDGRKGGESWLGSEPTRVPLPQQRQPDTVYHFLLGDPGMANFDKDPVIKSMAPAELQRMNSWRKQFNQPYSEASIRTLKRLSDAVDKLWDRHISDLNLIRLKTDDWVPVWGMDENPLFPRKNSGRSTREKDDIYNQELLSKKVRNSSAYRRLKLAMDYWCALWFWPIQQAQLLPTREEFHLDLMLILEGSGVQMVEEETQQKEMFPETQPLEDAKAMQDEFGYVDVDDRCEKIPRLGLVAKLADRYRFHHWELHFADVFAQRGGFDLILGNPPWLKVEWNEGGVMSDAQPLFILRNFSASKQATLREETLTNYGLTDTYFAEYEEAVGTQNFLNGEANYPLLKGVPANLYKCFLPQAWMLNVVTGVSGFVHPEGIYDDPKGGDFRMVAYSHLRHHFHFKNELALFQDVNHRQTYSLNVFKKNPSRATSFQNISNLFSPFTIENCYAHHGDGPVEGIKDNLGNWNTKGHHGRIVTVDTEALRLFARIFDPPGTTPQAARLPAIHSRQLLSVLQKFADQPKRLADLQGEYFSTEMWNETNRQKDGTIKEGTRFPKDVNEWILSGPHFFVGNPFNKTPQAICTKKEHYDIIDLTEIPDDYLPRTKYVPGCEDGEYRNRVPVVHWKGGGDAKITRFFRLVTRKLMAASNERSLIPTILPVGPSHMDGAFTITLKDQALLPYLVGLFMSIPYDFFVKTAGKSNFRNDLAQYLPVPQFEHGRAMIHSRVLALSSLTLHYEPLWNSEFKSSFNQDFWTRAEGRLSPTFFGNLTSTWQRGCALRTDYVRRQALVEIDVLAAMALGLTLEELQTIYRIQFSVMQAYEKDTWFDQNGRIIFTSSKGLSGVCLPRKADKKTDTPGWEDVRHMTSGSVEHTVTDDTLPGGPRQKTIVYQAPFDRCDREEDYAIAWKAFSERLDQGKTP